jgi:hypothetical protein
VVLSTRSFGSGLTLKYVPSTSHRLPPFTSGCLPSWHLGDKIMTAPLFLLEGFSPFFLPQDGAQARLYLTHSEFPNRHQPPFIDHAPAVRPSRGTPVPANAA